jgi:integrase/recombinase XerD
MRGIPKSLSRDQVCHLLSSCDRRTSVGRRDYAVLLLLARLGLRAGEVAGLNIEDIDWETGTITVRRKGGTLHQLPLPAKVGEAIAAYLLRGRPTAPTRRLFVRVSAPIEGLAGQSVILLVGRALARAGIRSASNGAHQLRHTLATDMLRRGATLSDIGQVLGHESPKTTAIYAKVDFAALRPLAQPWPGDLE